MRQVIELEWSMVLKVENGLALLPVLPISGNNLNFLFSCWPRAASSRLRPCGVWKKVTYIKTVIRKWHGHSPTATTETTTPHPLTFPLLEQICTVLDLTLWLKGTGQFSAGGRDKMKKAQSQPSWWSFQFHKMKKEKKKMRIYNPVCPTLIGWLVGYQGFGITPKNWRN